MRKIYFLFIVLITSVCFSQNASSVDPTFQHVNLNANIGSGQVKVVVAPNGKIYAGGIFADQNPVVDKIVRFTSTGAIDGTFNKGTGFSTYDMVQALALQSDNKIIVGGSLTFYNGSTVKTLVRINEDGSIDNTFNVGLGTGNGSYYTGGIVNSLKILPDGKILVAGDFRLFNGVVVNNLVRLNSDGSLDSSFNTSVFTGSLNCVQVEGSTGKIYIAGTPSGSFNGILRLEANGQQDTTFAITGQGFNSGVVDLAILNDGKVIAVGGFTALINYDTGFQHVYRIARLNLNGSLDTSFTAKFNENILLNGTLPSNRPVSLFRVLVKNDGKILVCGSFDRYNTTYFQENIAQLNQDGSSDVAFNAGYKFPLVLTDLALQPDNKIIVGGPFEGYGGNSSYSQVMPINRERLLPV